MTTAEIINYVLGGTNLGTFLLFLRTWKSSVRKETALSRQEEANSVVKSQEIYDKLTADLDRQIERFEARFKMQDDTIAAQNAEIRILKEKLEQYKKQCSNCVNNRLS